MNKNICLSALLTFSLVGAGCEKKVEVVIPSPTPIDITRTPESATATLETKKLGTAIDQYASTPSAENAADVKRAFADLDGEIAELQARVAKTSGSDQAEAQAKLTNMQTYRAKETARYAAATATAPQSNMTPIEPVDTRTGAEKIEHTLDKVGRSIEHSAENVGDKVKDATGQ
ncbi:MAG: hypothetical protein ABIT76_01950 [Chthoniobacterales bacterium]